MTKRALALHDQEDKSVHDTKNRYHNSDHLQGVGYGERLIKNPQYLFSQFPVTGNEYSLTFSELVSNERSCLVEIGTGLEIDSHRCVSAYFRPVAVKGGAVHDYHAALCAIIIEDTCNYKTLYALGSWKFEPAGLPAPLRWRPGPAVDSDEESLGRSRACT
jgi:hypothetical protein